MQKFTAVAFFSIGKYLAYAKSGASRVSREIKINSVPVIQEEEKGRVLLAIRSQCKEIGLSVSTRCVDSIIASLAAGTTVGDYVDALGQLENTISWEMEDKLFMYIPADRAEFYDKHDLFGSEVNVKFPGIQFDILEAGNSYASGLGTACVFHLMRIMEFAVQQLGKSLGVTLTDEKNWQNILNEINKRVKVLPPKDISSR